MATHPIQYQAPLWRALARRNDFNVHVFFGSDLSVRGYRDPGFGVNVRWDVPLTAGYKHTFLSRDALIQSVDFWRPGASGVHRQLEEFRPDVVLLTAYNSLFLLAGFFWAQVHRVPTVMRHEASDVAMARSQLKAMLRDAILRVFYSRAAGFGAIGTEARRHLLRLGVPPQKIGWAPYCVDSEQIEQQVQKWRPQRDRIRSELGIGVRDFVLIFSGKLIGKKQPLLIPLAVENLPEELRARLHLIVMGDGDQREAMEEKSRSVFGPRLHMAGFVNQSEMGRWYGAADCLVLPSKSGAGETWGLVVNEALQFGIPAIVSDGVGCHRDLVDGDTGRIFRSDSAEELGAAITAIADDGDARRLDRVEACRRKAEEFSLSAAARGLHEVFLKTSVR